MGLFSSIADKVVPYIPSDKLPTSARTLVSTLQGNKSLIDEKNFTTEELKVISDLIFIAGDKRSIDYPDYVKLGKKYAKDGSLPYSLLPSILSIGDALGNVQTTLGRFSFKPNENGGYIVNDKYDFNPLDSGATKEVNSGANGPYGIIRGYAGEKIPPGRGREVKINVPLNILEDSTKMGKLFP